MKKILLSASVILSFALYAFLSVSSVSTSATAPIAISEPAPPSTASVPKVVTQPIPAKKPTPVAIAPAPAKKTGQYADGTYTGSAADAYYGYVQVQATITGGRIADVAFLQYPNDRGTSRAINSQAMPYLKQEAIQAQSANVNGVSGASDTSAAFKQSLSSALAQAAA